MKVNPPQRPLQFLRWFCREDYLEEIEGDLTEVFIKESESSPRAAKWKFAWSVVKCFRPEFMKSFKNHQPNAYGMYRSYFRIGWRNVIRNKGYSFINIGGLAIGLAAVMLLALYIEDERIYDSFHAKEPHLYRVVTEWVKTDGSSSSGNTGLFQGPKFRENIPEITNAARWVNDLKTFRINDDIQDWTVFRTDSRFFSMFSFHVLSGNPLTALNEPKAIVITDEKAQTLFNTTDVLGRTLEIKDDKGFTPYVITAVVEKPPSHSSIRFDFILPLEVHPKDYANNENWFSFYLNTFVELRPGIDPALVEQKMNYLFEQDASATILRYREQYNFNDKVNHLLQPLREMHLSQRFPVTNGLEDGSNTTYSYILSGIAIFILLIACINFINLSLSRSLKRAKEIGIRKVIGSHRADLVTQFMGESFMLCSFSFIVALGLVLLTIPLFNDLAGKSIQLSDLLNARLAAANVAIFIVTSCIAGFYPSVILSGFSPVRTVYGRLNISGKSYLPKALVVVQFALSAFLIMATITIFSQLNFMTTKNLGYDDKDLVQVEKFPLSPKEYQVFKERLKRNSSILDVTPKNRGEWGTQARINGDEIIEFQYTIADETYLPMLKIDLVSGRNFSALITTDSADAVLVNEAFVRKAGWNDPLDQQVDFFYRNKKCTVVGIVKDHHFGPLTEEISPQLFTMKADEGYGRIYIRVSSQNKKAALAHIEKTYKELFPDYSYAYQFSDEINRQQYRTEARWRKIILIGSVLSVFVSCIGLLGLAALDSERRVKEIGVRKVLGSSVLGIMKLLTTKFLVLVVAAFVLAVPLVYTATNQWLSSYAYRVEFSGLTALATLLIISGIAIIAVGFQAARAAMANPVRSLRSE